MGAPTRIESGAGRLERPEGVNDVKGWYFYQLIKVAKEINLIGANTEKQSDLARDYRNLIHPAVAERKKATAARSTAFGAFAGMDMVAADLETYFAKKASAASSGIVKLGN